MIFSVFCGCGRYDIKHTYNIFFCYNVLTAPEIVHAVLTGNLPDSFSVDRLKQALPVLWSVQKKMLGIGS